MASLPRRPAIALAICLATPAAATAAPAWTTPEYVSAAGQDASDPAIAVSAAGGTLLAWRRSDGANTRVQTGERAPGATAWSAAVTRGDSGVSVMDPPAVAVGANGGAAVVWSVSGALRHMARRDGVWSAMDSAPAALSGMAPAGPRIGLDGDGDAAAIWKGAATGWNIQMAERTVAGTWSSRVDLSTTGNVGNDPGVAVAPDGTALVVWENDGVVYGRIRTGGTWSGRTTLSDPALGAYQPRVVINAAGQGVAVWRGHDGFTTRVQARTFSGGSWGSRQALSNAGVNAHYPDVAVAPDGEAVVVWYQPVGSDDRVHAVAGTGGTWGAPEAIGAAGGDAGPPRIAIGADGVAVAGWDLVEGATTVAQAAIRTPDGAWQATLDVGTHRTTQMSGGMTPVPVTRTMAVAVDDGNPVAAWYDRDGANSRIRTATFDRTGPALSGVTVPAAATAGEPVNVTAGAADRFSATGDTTWAWGDGGTTTGGAASHTYTAAGTYTVTVTAADVLGNTTSATRSITVAASAPPPGPAPETPAPEVPDPPGTAPRPDPPAGTPSLGALPGRAVLGRAALPLTVRCTGGPCEVRLQVRAGAAPLFTRVLRLAGGRRTTVIADLRAAAGRFRRQGRLALTVDLSSRLDGRWDVVSTGRTTLVRAGRT